MKRKFLALLMALCMVFSVTGFAKEEKVEVVTTIFPMYDWVKNILGEAESKVSLSLLVDSGIDLHNFQPAVEDFVKLSKADLFIYLGGPSDSWAEDAVKEAKNKDQRALNLMEALGELVKEAEHVEGMEEHDHHHDHHHHVDEHIWLSLKNAKMLVKAIAEELAQLLPEDAETIQANAQSYLEKLDALDKEYQAVVDGAENKTLLFGDRFPFLYLMDDYGLTYYAAFSGCSAESEASFETVAFLATKMDEEKLSCIFAIDGSTQQVAKAILGASKDASRPILVLDSMQTVNRDMIDKGVSYLGIMENNLLVLKQALK